jgi:hypothetical protein
MPKEESREVRRAIRRVLLEVWDPIGIGDEPNAQDEYDGYVGPIFELLAVGKSDRDIEQYLHSVVSGMGMDSSRVSLANVVAALRQTLPESSH